MSLFRKIVGKKQSLSTERRSGMNRRLLCLSEEVEDTIILMRCSTWLRDWTRIEVLIQILARRTQWQVPASPIHP